MQGGAHGTLGPPGAGAGAGNGSDDGLVEDVVDPGTLGVELYMACRDGKEGKAVELLGQGAPGTYRESPKWGCLEWASLHGMTTTVELLLRQKCNGCQPLHWAAMKSHLRIVWLLLDAGYPCDDTDECGNTPLHLAASAGHLGVVKALAGADADVVGVKNKYGNTPVTLAKTPEMQQVLATWGQDPSSEWAAGEHKHIARHNHLRTYHDVGQRLEDLMHPPTIAEDTEEENPEDDDPTETFFTTGLATRVDDLAAALEEARHIGQAAGTIDLGARALRRLKKHVELRAQVDIVRRAQPVITQENICQLVNKMIRLAREARKLRDDGIAGVSSAPGKTRRDDWDDDRDIGAPLRFLEDVDALALRSKAEFWVNCCTEPLAAMECADDTAKRPMEKLTGALATAELRGADPKLITRARRALLRSGAELDLQKALDDLPDLSDDDLPTGAIQETPEFPNLPVGHDAYIWNPPPALTHLQAAVKKLATALRKCPNDVFKPLLETAKDKSAQAHDALTAYEKKDFLDHQLAVAAAEKLAKKLKKKLAAQAAADKAASSAGGGDKASAGDRKLQKK